MIGQDPYHGPGQAHGTRLGASLVRRNRAHTNFFLPIVFALLPALQVSVFLSHTGFKCPPR
jgi:hypothetical protein